MKLSERVLGFTYVPSPIGDLLLAGEGGRLELLSFPTGSRTRCPLPSWRRDDPGWQDARAQLAAYFAGRLDRFALPLSPSGTAFQLAVWQALQAIPYGGTCSYSEIARRIGRPAATRAVGAANGANPLPIVVPCHRVIGANGTLTGFGGGMDAKRHLLDLEASATRRTCQ